MNTSYNHGKTLVKIRRGSASEVADFSQIQPPFFGARENDATSLSFWLDTTLRMLKTDAFRAGNTTDRLQPCHKVERLYATVFVPRQAITDIYIKPTI